MTDERTMRERTLAGDLYITDDPQIGVDSVKADAVLSVQASVPASAARQASLTTSKQP